MPLCESAHFMYTHAGTLCMHSSQPNTVQSLGSNCGKYKLKFMTLILHDFLLFVLTVVGYAGKSMCV